MPKAKRNIGHEILEGIRQLKRGAHGRVTKVPSVTSIRACRCGRSRSGNRVVWHHQVLPEPCC